MSLPRPCSIGYMGFHDAGLSSKDEILSRVGKTGSPVALILGNAGSHVNDFTHQVAFYRSHSFTTLVLNVSDKTNLRGFSF